MPSIQQQIVDTAERRSNNPCAPMWLNDTSNEFNCPYGERFHINLLGKKIYSNITLPLKNADEPYPFFTKFALAGSLSYILSFLLLAVMIYQSTMDKQSKKWFYGVIYTVAIASVIVNQFKLSKYKSPRPEQSCNVNCAFISMHSMVSAFFAIMSIYLLKYSPNKTYGKIYVAILNLMWVWTMASRIMLKDHTIRQVATGSGIGASAALFTCGVLAVFIK